MSTRPQTQPMTLAELAELASAGGDARSKSAWSCILRALGPGTPVVEVTTATIARWVMAESRRLKPGTVNRRAQRLRTALKLAADLGIIETVPRVPSLKDRSARDRLCTPAELETICGRCSPRVAYAVRVLYWSGLRRGELCKLTWSQVDLHARMVRVHGCQAKNGKARSVPMPDRLVAIFFRWRQMDPDAPVIGLHPETVTRGFTRACRSAGIEDLRLHDLRHTALTRYRRKANCSIFVLAAIAGHSSVATAARYQTVDDEDLRRVAGLI